MRGTAWPAGAYRTNQDQYDDGAPRPTVDTISGVLHVRENVFGHKWVYKLNESRRGAEKKIRKECGANYFFGIVVGVVIFGVVCAAVVFTLLGPKYFNKLKEFQENQSVKLLSRNLNNTKLIFRIHTKSNSSRSTITISKNITETKYENKTEKIEMLFGCLKRCKENEICIQNTSSAYPECIIAKDINDPTGCGGLCQLEVQYCKKLIPKFNIFSCIDIKTLTCTKKQWKCKKSLMCISNHQKCDGIINCYDKFDEIGCDCDLKNNFQCSGNISCFPNNKKCNGSADCWDASDEKNCTKDCGSFKVPCNNGECISSEKFCDGSYDCKDKSDEPKGCVNNNNNKTTTESGIR